MLLCRARAALRVEQPDGELPLLRMIGAHHHVYGVMQATPPRDDADRPRLWLGDGAGERRDDLAYAIPGMPPGIRYNAITAAAALPVLLALLPGAAPLRWSTAAPFGLPGGYPVRIADGRVELDLPDGVDLDEAVAFCTRIAHGDGVERIDDDGVVHFTDGAWEALGAIAPDLLEPLALEEVDARATRLLELLG